MFMFIGLVLEKDVRITTQSYLIYELYYILWINTRIRMCSSIYLQAEWFKI